MTFSVQVLDMIEKSDFRKVKIRILIKSQGLSKVK